METQRETHVHQNRTFYQLAAQWWWMSVLRTFYNHPFCFSLMTRHPISWLRHNKYSDVIISYWCVAWCRFSCVSPTLLWSLQVTGKPTRAAIWHFMFFLCSKIHVNNRHLKIHYILQSCMSISQQMSFGPTEKKPKGLKRNMQEAQTEEKCNKI